MTEDPKTGIDITQPDIRGNVPLIKITADTVTDIEEIVDTIEKDYFIVHYSVPKPNDRAVGYHTFLQIKRHKEEAE